MRLTDPLRSYCYRVEIDGIAVAAFQSVSGLDVKVQMTEYREGTDRGGVRKLPAFPAYESNITLVRGQTSVNSAFWDWHRELAAGQIQRRDGSVILCNEAGDDQIRWDWREGWLCELSGGELDAGSVEVMINTAQICHEELHCTYLT